MRCLAIPQAVLWGLYVPLWPPKSLKAGRYDCFGYRCGANMLNRFLKKSNSLRWPLARHAARRTIFGRWLGAFLVYFDPLQLDHKYVRALHACLHVKNNLLLLSIDHNTPSYFENHVEGRRSKTKRSAQPAVAQAHLRILDQTKWVACRWHTHSSFALARVVARDNGV